MDKVLQAREAASSGDYQSFLHNLQKKPNMAIHGDHMYLVALMYYSGLTWALERPQQDAECKWTTTLNLERVTGRREVRKSIL